MNLETERLRLRFWKMEDAECLYELACDAEVGPACGWKPHQDLAESKEILKNVLMNDYTYAIVSKESGEVIGCISTMPESMSRYCENEKQVEIGFWLGRPYWGNGYMPEACKAVISYCFETLELEKVWCGHNITNEKSKRAQEKIGFQFAYLDEARSLVVNHMRREDFFLIVKR